MHISPLAKGEIPKRVRRTTNGAKRNKGRGDSNRVMISHTITIFT